MFDDSTRRVEPNRLFSVMYKFRDHLHICHLGHRQLRREVGRLSMRHLNAKLRGH